MPSFHPFSALLLLFAALPVNARSFEADFSKQAAGVFIETEGVTLHEGRLLLPPGLLRAESRLLPVRAGEKYRLQMMASVEGDFTIEQNDRAHLLILTQPRQSFSSTYEVLFYDRHGEEIPPVGRWEQRPGGFFLTRKAELYTAVFDTPDKATGLKVHFHPNRQSTQIHRLDLLPETEEGTINANPDFRYGELNYSGWKPSRAGRLYRRPDGKVVFDAGYGGHSPRIPLSAGERYHVSAKGDEGTITIRYYKADGSTISSRHLLKLSPKGEETELIPPEETASCILNFYHNALVHEVRITRAR